MKKNAFYAQSGGVTSVINATAGALILEAKNHKLKIGKVYAGKNGILGALREDLIDTSKESISAIKNLRETPGGVFGSCRFKLKNLDNVLAIWATSSEWVILVLKWSPDVFTKTWVLCLSLRKAVEWIILSLSLWKSDLKWVFFSWKNLPFDFSGTAKFDNVWIEFFCMLTI